MLLWYDKQEMYVIKIENRDGGKKRYGNLFDNIKMNFHLNFFFICLNVCNVFFIVYGRRYLFLILYPQFAIVINKTARLYLPRIYS